MASHGFADLVSVNFIIPILILLTITSLLRNRYKSDLREIPGPAIAAYTKLWRVYNVWKGSPQLTAIELHRKHGKLVRMAPNVVSVSDPNEMTRIYNFKGDFLKTAFYPLQSIVMSRQVRTNVFSTRSEEEHRDWKKRVAKLYALESLLKSEPGIDSCSKLLLSRLGEHADRKESVHLGDWLMYYAFDVVGELTFGEKIGFLEKGGDVNNIISSNEPFMFYVNLIGQVPEAHHFLLGNPLLRMSVPQMETENPVLNMVKGKLARRTKVSKAGEIELTGEEKGEDMFSKWAAVDPSDPYKLDYMGMINILCSNMFAGADTTGIALRACIYFLVKNPTKLQKLRQEIENAEKAGKISNPISDKEARLELPYVNAAIKEAMRMHASIGMLLERHVPPGGVSICGKHIPGGTIVGINPWVLNYDAEVFPDPEAYEPERWLASDGNSEQLSRMDKTFFTFGGGNRVCMGKNISLIETRKLVPQLLREYDVEFTDNKEWTMKNIWFIPQEMPPCILKRRK